MSQFPAKSFTKMMLGRMSTLYLLLLISGNINLCYGHGRLLRPVARSSLRFKYFNDFGLPIDYNDNQLFCGGFGRQQANGGRCGICGDPWDGPRDHEAGGRFAPGFAVESYTEGDIIDVTVQLTANHLGWFEFRICPNEDFDTPATQQCLDQNLLEITYPVDLAIDTRYFVNGYDRSVALRLQLPPGLVCTTQCVFQWKYNTGNSWGTDSNGVSCHGCGPQEQFYGCADVTISPSSGATTTTSTKSTSTSDTTTTDGSSTTPPDAPATTTSPAAASTTKTTTTTTGGSSTAAANTPATINSTTVASTTEAATTTTNRSTTASNTPAAGGDCVAAGAYKMTPGMTNWCKMNCPGNCPSSHCSAGCRTPPSSYTTTTTTDSSTTASTTPSAAGDCVAVGPYKIIAGMIDWCNNNCQAGNCPLSHCSTDCCAIYQVQCTGIPPSTDTCEAAWANDPGTTQWCNDNCSLGNCPMSHCSEGCCKIYNLYC